MISIYWERRWSQDVEGLKREFGIWDPPPAVWGSPRKPTTVTTKLESA